MVSCAAALTAGFREVSVSPQSMYSCSPSKHTPFFTAQLHTKEKPLTAIPQSFQEKQKEMEQRTRGRSFLLSLAL